MYSSPLLRGILSGTDERPFRRSRNPATDPANTSSPVNAAILSMNNLRANTAPKPKPDALFGPNIGVVSHGPPWTDSATREKKLVQDELTPEVVRSWIEKSRQASQPTTTLQALVNLKRPTIKLSPLTTDDSTVDLHHGLEFEYDCDAPKCGIYVHVLLDSLHPDAGSATPSQESSSTTKLLLFETVVDGGFSNTLNLEQGAVLELSRFEQGAGKVSPGTPNESTVDIPATNASSTSINAAGNSNSNNLLSPAEPSRRRRFTHFHFRRRADHNVAGPALALVDAAVAKDAIPEENEGHGVRITIRVAALDPAGAELNAPNEQTTYLHVVRFGSKPAEGEDTRPWVVKVVKREATIGPHTFQLHEIYGLTTANTNSATAPTALPVVKETHSYPPQLNENSDPEEPVMTATTPNILTQEDDSPVSECLLCLSSPREVVLLPCRHLVSCRDCALNMIRFGAGEILTHTDDTAADNNPAETVPTTEAGNGTDSAPATATATSPAPAPTVPRRKRKAKGWACPVCRQPYTSLLRITTTLPTANAEPEPHDHNETTESTNDVAGDPLDADAQRSGILGSLRPGFIRALTRGGTAERDLERQ